MSLPKCVHLQDLRHVSLMTKIYRLLQLISLCTFNWYNCDISIDSYTPIYKINSFAIFSLLINAVMLLLKGLDLIHYLYIHFLSLDVNFLY